MSDSNLLRDKLRSHLAKERDLMSGQMKNPTQFHYQGLADFVLREGQYFEPRDRGRCVAPQGCAGLLPIPRRSG